VSSQHAAADLDPTMLRVIRRAAAVLANQSGDGIRRQVLVEMAGTSPVPVTVVAAEPAGGQPAVAIVHPAPAGADQRFNRLTGRERQVAAMLADGATNAQIAAALVVTVGTVKDHVHRILTKSGLPNRTAVGAAWRDA
jgi:DNA-binding NarL/FixJ family response regulator